ncbi:MAG: 50S ribosomal protein L22 [Holosporales bacterium]|jgi:large subunit ribosomal protein L22|nr:50S ribosomal protein L22 [Holosporales bacterium]
MEERVTLKKIRVSPQKLNLVAAAIRGLDIMRATSFLRVCRKRVAKDVLKLLSSAVANLENNYGLDVEGFFVAEAFVGQGFSLRRFMARGRGRGNSIRKPFSHLTIKISDGKGRY